MLSYSVLAALAAFAYYFVKVKPRKLPPGPPTGFLGDNRAQVPDAEPWKTFWAWSKQFNAPIISFYLGRHPNIVVNDMKSAYDLLDKRGEIYSSRPRNIMGQEILSGNMRGLGMEYGPRYRQWRKFQHTGMAHKNAHTYRFVQELESSVLLRDLSKDPNNYSVSVKRFATSVAFAISYGKRIQSLDEKVVLDNQRAMFAFGRTTMPGRYIVESWPILLWLPKPLQWFRKEFEKDRQLDIELYTRCLSEVQRKMDEGRAKDCLSSHMLRTVTNGELSFVQMSYAVSSSFSAGISTVTAALDVLLLALLLNPTCARKAQAEIDSVVGQTRLPSFEDETALPYLKAMIKESMRWRPVAPTGVAHAVTQDDYYEGYFIPKGATVYANIYAISKDPEVFPDPETFDPERFVSPSHPRVVDFDLPFGFGRRICPGQHVALQSIFIVISRMLWAFDILPALSSDGRPAPLDDKAFVGGLVSRPQPFKMRLVPRNPDVLKLIEASAMEADADLVAWD